MLVGKDLYTFQYKQRYCLITVRLFHLNTAMQIMKNTNKATMVSLDINDIMQPFLQELKLFFVPAEWQTFLSSERDMKAVFWGIYWSGDGVGGVHTWDL